mmetsp:Transcript_32019/g.73659  ORF Transcript_32019/g.73659 Transcript_32019/m.73659 type:complete len:238 (-) Transcript_32019:845-1558(-)
MFQLRPAPPRIQHMFQPRPSRLLNFRHLFQLRLILQHLFQLRATRLLLILQHRLIPQTLQLKSPILQHLFQLRATRLLLILQHMFQPRTTRLLNLRHLFQLRPSPIHKQLLQQKLVTILEALRSYLVLILSSAILSKHQLTSTSTAILTEDLRVVLFCRSSNIVLRHAGMIALLQYLQLLRFPQQTLQPYQWPQHLSFVRPWQQKIMQNMKKKLKKFIDQFQDKMPLMVLILIGWML